LVVWDVLEQLGNQASAEQVGCIRLILSNLQPETDLMPSGLSTELGKQVLTESKKVKSAEKACFILGIAVLQVTPQSLKRGCHFHSGILLKRTSVKNFGEATWYPFTGQQ
jgi:hypothetical protein